MDVADSSYTKPPLLITRKVRWRNCTYHWSKECTLPFTRF